MAAPVGPIVFGGLIAWGIYRRVRRNIGQQQLRPTRLKIRLVILFLVTLLLCGLGVVFPKILPGFGGGLILGGAAGYFGVRLTKFETTEQGHFYTPNTMIGVALSVLLVGRVIYNRMPHDAVAGSNAQIFQSSLTLLIVGLNLGYYLVYNIGLLVHTHDRKPDSPSDPGAS